MGIKPLEKWLTLRPLYPTLIYPLCCLIPGAFCDLPFLGDYSETQMGVVIVVWGQSTGGYSKWGLHTIGILFIF